MPGGGEAHAAAEGEDPVAAIVVVEHNPPTAVLEVDAPAPVAPPNYRFGLQVLGLLLTAIIAFAALKNALKN